jgi:hypothetical protein
MHLIVYISKISEQIDDVESTIKNIVESAKQNNKSIDITGVLFYENGYFLQALEGQKDVVNATYDKISKDSRHHQFIKIIDEPISTRSFADWSMDTFYIDSPTLITPDNIVSFKELYEQCFELDSKNLMDFIKQMVDELDTFKILHED